MTTFCYPYTRGTGWRSQGFRSNRGQGANGPGGHTGYDQAMDAGTPIYAPGDGIVRNSSWVTDNYLENPWWLTQMGGDILVLDCTDAFGRTDTMPTFIFAHLSDSIAEVGQRVRKGQLIALSGNSGTASTGPHLHTEALPPGWDFNNGVYGRVDPEQYFTEWPEDVAPALAAAGTTITPIKEESEMPAYKRVAATGKINHRLPKGGTYRLSAKDDGTSQNFAVNGPGHYLVDLFIEGNGLPAGETLDVTFEVVRKGRPSEYFTQQVHGTASGDYAGHAAFSGYIEGATLQAAVVSSKDSAYVTGFGADVATWKK